MEVDPLSIEQVALHMKGMVDRIKAGELPATKHLKSPELVELANRTFREAKIKDALFVLSKIPNRRTEKYLRKRLAERGLKPSGIIQENPSIAASWLRGTPLDVRNRKKEAERIIAQLKAAANT